MGKQQFNLRLDEELIKRFQDKAKEQDKTITQCAIEALNLWLGTPIDQQQSELSLEAIDERIEANLDYRLLDIRDSLATNLDSKLADIDKLAQKLDSVLANNNSLVKPPTKLKQTTKSVLVSDGDLVICKLDNTDRGNSSKWRYFAGFKEGFVEQLDQARTYNESTVRQMGGRIAKSPHAASEGEMISWRSLAELKQLVVHA